jgi:hypothetical protein
VWRATLCARTILLGEALRLELFSHLWN